MLLCWEQKLWGSPMWFFALLLGNPVCNIVNVTTGTTKGNNNHCVTFPIITVTDWLSGIVECDDQRVLQLTSWWLLMKNAAQHQHSHTRNWQKCFLVARIQSTINNTSSNKVKKNCAKRIVFFLYGCFFWQAYFSWTETSSAWVKKQNIQQPTRFCHFKHTNTSSHIITMINSRWWAKKEWWVAKLKITMAMMSDFWHWKHQKATRNGGWEESTHPWKNTIVI